MSGPMDPKVERVARALVKLDDHPRVGERIQLVLNETTGAL